MKAYLFAWKKIGDYHNRARREEFWGFTLVNLFAVITLWKIDYYFEITFFQQFGYFSIAYSFFALFPLLSLHARRLNDLNKSFGAILINLLPLVGNIIYLVWMLSPSKKRAYYPKAEFFPEAQMKNRVEGILMFFFGIKVFGTLVELIFRRSYSIIELSNFYTQAKTVLYYQALAGVLLHCSLVFLFKEKKHRIIGFILVGLYSIIPLTYHL